MRVAPLVHDHADPTAPTRATLSARPRAAPPASPRVSLRLAWTFALACGLSAWPALAPAATAAPAIPLLPGCPPVLPVSPGLFAPCVAPFVFWGPPGFPPGSELPAEQQFWDEVFPLPATQDQPADPTIPLCADAPWWQGAPAFSLICREPRDSPPSPEHDASHKDP
jgi:hypothetical protein